ncbi:MAG: DUF4062 domain-containing protein [Verrucomicrobia bacterium]|nr:DUF4062 domain-containing protein [Verrucomicrobiota bacterium]MCB8930264.1 DUF4062 domain-containing protein [Bacteroidia bacterium]MCW5931583.1 DUF4062 domain-containing protein [Bacteroidota bacterium]
MGKKAAIPVKKKVVAKKAIAKKAAVPKKKQLTIMVSSTVYGAEADLDQIAAILRQQFGYKVIMSKEGSVYVPVGFTPEQACLKAVEDCDLFFGIIFPRYGSGITHKEFLEANRLDKPRWFISHEKIEYLRKLLQPKMYTKKGKRTKFSIPKTTVLDSIKVVDMYNDVRANWVQSFTQLSEVMIFLETQFGDMQKRIDEIENVKKKNK